MSEPEARYVADVLARAYPRATISVAVLDTGVWRVTVEPADGSAPHAYCYGWEVLLLYLQQQEARLIDGFKPLFEAVSETRDMVSRATGGNRAGRRLATYQRRGFE